MTNTGKNISAVEFLLTIARATFVTIVGFISPWLIIPAYILADGLTRRPILLDVSKEQNEQQNDSIDPALTDADLQQEDIEILEAVTDFKEEAPAQPTKKARKPRAQKPAQNTKQATSPKTKTRRSTKN